MKKKVLVLFGGVSSEHDVSLNSASSVMKNIPAEKYDIVPMGITKDGRCFVFNGSPDLLPDGNWLKDEALLEPAVISCDRSHHGIIRLADGAKVEYIDLHRMGRFMGCTACMGCREEKSGMCVNEDALRPVLQKIHSADGLIIEVHNDPMKAWCDGAQSLTPERYESVAKKVFTIREVVKK